MEILDLKSQTMRKLKNSIMLKSPSGLQLLNAWIIMWTSKRLDKTLKRI
jgi:hypothetical protein